MKENKIFLLGTGCAVPNKLRNAPGILISYFDGIGILLDIGSGISQKIIEHDINFRNIKYILLSHLHADHVSDLIYFLKANFMLGRKEKLLISGPKGLSKFMEYLLEAFKYLKDNVNFYEIKEMIPGSMIQIDKDFNISSISVPHGDESIAFRIERDQHTIIYSGDTGYSEELISFSKEADILIHECSYTELKKGEGHVCPSELATIAKKANVKQLIVTHFYPFCDPQINEIHASILSKYKGNLIMGKDDDIVLF